MIHSQGIIHCFCANALYRAQAIHWDKYNLTRFSTYFRFEDFSWMLLWVTDNAVAGHMRPVGLHLDHNGL